MSYLTWFENHAKKHKKIVNKLSHLSDDELIVYFEYDNMIKEEKDFCPLYAKNKKCHDIKNLNCYLCACPNFRFNDEGFKQIEDKTLFSYCGIESKDGSRLYGDTYIHQNCSKCTVPHLVPYIKKYFNRNWLKIMKKVKAVK